MKNDSQTEHPVVAWRKALLSDGSLYPPHDLGSTARLVGLGLSMHAYHDMRSWPSAPRVGARCGLSERAVRRGFEALEAAGWVEAVERGGVAGGRRTTVWKLITPEPLSGVTPVPESEVVETTPDSLSTTPEPDAPTPVAESDELEELDTELGERSLAEIAAGLLAQHPEEAAAALGSAAARWGEGRVGQLVRAYATAGVRFVWASDLLTRLDQDAPQAVRAAPPVAAYCAECSRQGWVLPLGSNDAVRCKCNPDPREATA